MENGEMMKDYTNIIIQTKVNDKISIARVRCGRCNCDFFELIEKGRMKELICEECREEMEGWRWEDERG